MQEGSVLGIASTVADIDFDRVRSLLTAAGAPVLLGLEGRAAGLRYGGGPRFVDGLDARSLLVPGRVRFRA